MRRWIEVTRTITPLPMAIMCGSRARSRRTAASRFTFSSLVQSSSPSAANPCGRCLGSAEGVDQYVDTAHAGVHLGDDAGGALGGGQVGSDERSFVDLVGATACGDEYGRTGLRETKGDGGSGALGAAGDQSATAFEGFADGWGHGVFRFRVRACGTASPR